MLNLDKLVKIFLNREQSNMSSIELKLSIIIPTLNGVGRIEECLASIAGQDFKRENYEIILVDDESEDETVEVCKSLGVDKILVSGKRDIEASKALGIEAAEGQFLLFIDDDNRLVSESWLSEGVKILNSDLDIGGVESAYFNYQKGDTPANRYCSLIGAVDPVVFYLKRTAQLPIYQKEWLGDCSECVDEGKYFKLRFLEKAVPAIGSGFLTRSTLVRDFPYSGRFLHMDFCEFISKTKGNSFAITKDSIVHNHCLTVSSFVKKCKRNGRIYLQDEGTRNYSYDLTFKRKVVLAAICLTLVVPIYDAIRGFRKRPDWAWFIHPLVSFWVFTVYVKLFISNRARSVMS